MTNNYALFNKKQFISSLLENFFKKSVNKICVLKACRNKLNLVSNIIFYRYVFKYRNVVIYFQENKYPQGFRSFM